MTRFVKFSILALIGVSLTGCSYISSKISSSSFIHNKDKTYLQAQSYPPLIIPPGVPANDFSTSYPVSNRVYPERVKDVSILPPGL
jgi:uncharacterized lipoprotein